MLSDSPLLKDRKANRNRAVDAGSNKFWSDKQKIEAVTTYIMLGGNLALTSRQLKIPEITMRKWKTTDWWNKLESDVRKEERMQLSSRLKNVMERSWDVVADRLEKGDWIYDQKLGELRRKPVTMKDAGTLAVQAAKLRNEMDLTENHTIAAEHIEDKLNKLAKAFGDLAKGKLQELPPAEDIQFVEVVENAVHEERKAGLQD